MDIKEFLTSEDKDAEDFLNNVKEATITSSPHTTEMTSDWEEGFVKLSEWFGARVADIPTSYSPSNIVVTLNFRGVDSNKMDVENIQNQLRNFMDISVSVNQIEFFGNDGVAISIKYSVESKSF